MATLAFAKSFAKNAPILANATEFGRTPPDSPYKHKKAAKPYLKGLRGHSYWSGRQDSNLRPSAPKADALARLRHAPFPKEDDKPSQNDCLSMLFQKILN